jgi:hypothetical protein
MAPTGFLHRSVRTAAVAALTLTLTTALPAGRAVASDTAQAARAAHAKLLWESSYNGGTGSHDYGHALAVSDTSIYVAAHVEDTEHPADFTLLRYTKRGVLGWERHFGGEFTRTGEPSDLTTVDGDAVIVGITRSDAGSRVDVRRYDEGGRLVWAARHRATLTFPADTGPKVAIAADGSLRVSATLDGAFLVLSYAGDGTLQWQRRIDAVAGQDDVATDLAVDAYGNTYVAGTVGDLFGGYTTAKVDSAGHVEWKHNVFGPFGSTLGPAFVDVDSAGNAVVSGVPESGCGVFQSRTWKYAPDGTLEWEVSLPTDPCDSIIAVGMQVRPDDSVVVLGTTGGSDPDFITMSYGPDGHSEWTRTYDSGSVDLASALAVDADGNAFITGVASIGMSGNDAFTASYDRTGEVRWRSRQDVDSQSERPVGIAVLPDSTVAVAGDYFDPSQLEDVFTMRYRQPR